MLTRNIDATVNKVVNSKENLLFPTVILTADKFSNKLHLDFFEA